MWPPSPICPFAPFSPTCRKCFGEMGPSWSTFAARRNSPARSSRRLVLKYLLGYPNVKNYDGSWTEWGNLVGAPIEKP